MSPDLLPKYRWMEALLSWDSRATFSSVSAGKPFSTRMRRAHWSTQRALGGNALQRVLDR